MPRLKENEKMKKQSICRDLYTKNLALTFIEEASGVQMRTIKKWAKENGWEDLKRANSITPSQIQNMILQCAETIRNGQVPAVSPDQLAKLASAYEKLSDKRQHLGYMIDSFDALRTFILIKVQNEEKKDKKQALLSLVQMISPLTDELIHQKFKEIEI